MILGPSISLAKYGNKDGKHCICHAGKKRSLSYILMDLKMVCNHPVSSNDSFFEYGPKSVQLDIATLDQVYDCDYVLLVTMPRLQSSWCDEDLCHKIRLG